MDDFFAGISLGGILIGMLLGAGLAVALSFPRTGRALGKGVAVVLMAVGTGLTVWGMYGALSGQFEAMEVGSILFSSAPQALGWGVGCLCGGITALTLAFVGRS